MTPANSDFFPTGLAPAGADASGAGRQRTALDNLIRRELRVGDPNDPQQIARALADRYQSDARAQSIDGEARGLPFLRSAQLRPNAPPPPMATNIDLEQALNDVGSDLRFLLTSSETKDIRPELEGWQTVIRRSIDEGVSAARYGLDPTRRDTAFAMRRQLGEYARLARLVGALTPDLNRHFRNLATSIDEACAVMLVLMGESMANLGFAGGRFLLQAPYSELQARRDAVLNALRQIDGVASQSLGGELWPRGLRAYRQLYTVLEAKGQGDLRSLMNEAELSRTMDELIQLSSGGSAGGLRALGATAWAPLNRLTRFVQTTLRLATPTSPGLATFQEALQLFIDGFVPAGGFRLLRVARPTVLNYGLYGSAAITPAELRLIDLVNRRGTLARALDCLTNCACDEHTVLAQIVLDKVLYDIDRAIDFYCVGDADLGLPEVRAAAVSHLIDALVDPAQAWAPALPRYLTNPAGPGLRQIDNDANQLIATQLDAIRRLLRPMGGEPNWATSAAVYGNNLNNNLPWLGGAPTTLYFGQVLHDELCLQRETDQQWRPVIEQMTSGCIPVSTIFDSGNGGLPDLVDVPLRFIARATAHAGTGPVAAGCVDLQPVVPQHFEESLQIIAARP
ncbi:hypothetical protein [Roseateles sp.]